MTFERACIGEPRKIGVNLPDHALGDLVFELLEHRPASRMLDRFGNRQAQATHAQTRVAPVNVTALPHGHGPA